MPAELANEVTGTHMQGIILPAAEAAKRESVLSLVESQLEDYRRAKSEGLVLSQQQVDSHEAGYGMSNMPFACRVSAYPLTTERGGYKLASNMPRPSDAHKAQGRALFSLNGFIGSAGF